MNNYLFIIITLLNIITAILFIYDKYASSRRLQRISEKTLILLSIFGSSITLYFLMYIIHHKTRKIKFTVSIPLIIAIQIFLLFYLSC